MRLGNAPDEQYVVVTGDQEDDFVRRVRSVRGDGQRGFDLGEVTAVVDDPNQAASDRIA